MDHCMKTRSALEKCCDEELFYQAFQAYSERTSAAVIERRYRQAKLSLCGALTEEQQAEWEEIELLHLQAAKAQNKYAFQCGLYAAFSHQFERVLEAGQFERLMRTHESDPAYHDLCEACMQRVDKLMQSLDGRREPVADLDAVWDARNYGIARHAYDLGYCTGCGIIKTVHSKTT
ncbi:MAG: hypothetical protein ACI4PD_07675 [Butyricicoccus sp.]